VNSSARERKQIARKDAFARWKNDEKPKQVGARVCDLRPFR